MCTVCGILNWGRSIPIDYWNPQRAYQFSEMVDFAREIDEGQGTPDCADDEKLKFLDMIETFLGRVPNNR